MNTFKTLEFNYILELLSDLAFSDAAKKNLLNLKPFLSEKECKLKMGETTQARQVLDNYGNPLLSFMADLEKIIELS